MPFRSEKQRRFMWAKHPDIARRWAKEYGSTPQPNAVTEYAKKVGGTASGPKAS